LEQLPERFGTPARFWPHEFVACPDAGDRGGTTADTAKMAVAMPTSKKSSDTSI
jgi:hypothetical protein